MTLKYGTLKVRVGSGVELTVLDYLKVQKDAIKHFIDDVLCWAFAKAFFGFKNLHHKSQLKLKVSQFLKCFSREPQHGRPLMPLAVWLSFLALIYQYPSMPMQKSLISQLFFNKGLRNFLWWLSSTVLADDNGLSCQTARSWLCQDMNS